MCGPAEACRPSVFLYRAEDVLRLITSPLFLSAGLVAGADRWRHTAAAAASEAPGTSTTEEAPLLLRYEALVPGQLVKRYKRFLGDVLLDGDGSSGGNAPAAAAAAAPAQSTQAAVTVVHVPNTGPMTGLLDALPAPALLSVSTDPKRKYAHTLEWLCPAGQVLRMAGGAERAGVALLAHALLQLGLHSTRASPTHLPCPHMACRAAGWAPTAPKQTRW